MRDWPCQGCNDSKCSCEPDYVIESRQKEHVLGVDVATKSGCAVYGDGTVKEYWTASEFEIVASMERAQKWGHITVAIETPYMNKNVQTLIKLAMICGQWKQEAIRCGVHAVGVTAKEWQSKILALGPRAKRKELKQASVANALRLWNKKLSEDEADAAGLAMYVSRKLRLERTTGGT